MDDSWSFRTERGRAWVADGTLRVERSARSLLRRTCRGKWSQVTVTRKALFVFSGLTTVATFSRLAPAVPALVGPGSLTAIQWFLLGCLGLLAVGFVWKATRSKAVPLADIESVGRANRTLRVRRGADESDPFELRARTDADAEGAAEVLRLKGVAVEADTE